MLEQEVKNGSLPQLLAFVWVIESGNFSAFFAGCQRFWSNIEA
jgi:hypothetical protein